MSYNQIFFGLLFLFDFRINGFDILPSFIGYILIYNGLKSLCFKNEIFNTSKELALPLIFLSISGIYDLKIPLNEALQSP